MTVIEAIENGLNDNNAFAILRPSSMEITNLKSNYISSFGLELNVINGSSQISFKEDIEH